MLRIARFLSIPRWLEQAWQETRIEAADTRPMGDLHEAETIPAALLARDTPPDLAF